MDKIKELLEKSGCKQELISSICESLVTYKESVKEQFEKDANSKIDAAKKVCIEETENHKRELARRVQIFCETKSAAINAQIQKQQQIGESGAMAKLKEVKSLLEGITINGQKNGQTSVALERAQRQVKALAEEKNKAIETANRYTQIAEKALKENRSLVAENTKLKKTVQAKPLVESKSPVQNTKRLDTGRNKSTAATTRPTLAENQSRTRPAQTIREATGLNSIQSIAAQIDD